MVKAIIPPEKLQLEDPIKFNFKVRLSFHEKSECGIDLWFKNSTVQKAIENFPVVLNNLAIKEPEYFMVHMELDDGTAGTYPQAYSRDDIERLGLDMVAFLDEFRNRSS